MENDGTVNNEGQVDGEKYNPPGNLFEVSDPPSTGPAPGGGDAGSDAFSDAGVQDVQSDTSGDDGSSAEGLGKESVDGLGDAQQVPEILKKHGFNSVEDVINSFIETKQRNTALSNQLKALEQQSKETSQKTPYSDEELDRLYSTDRVQYEKALEENLAHKLSQKLGLDTLSARVEDLSTDNMLNHLRNKYDDFRKYEKQIAQKAAQLGDDTDRFLTPQGLEFMYHHVKMEEQMKEINSKKAQAEEAKKNTKQAAKQAAAGAGGGGATPNKIEGDTQEKVEIEGVGSIDKDQLHFVQANPFVLTR